MKQKKKFYSYVSIVLKATSLSKNFPTRYKLLNTALSSHQNPQVVTEKIELIAIQKGEVELATVVENAKKCLKTMIFLCDPTQNKFHLFTTKKAKMPHTFWTNSIKNQPLCMC